jgi:5-methylcytosine-specific restriction endonuclease McrA
MSESEGNGFNGQKVLVLNNYFEPVNLCRWKRALVLIFKGKAETVENSGRLINQKYPVPRIIRLNYQVKIPRQEIMLTRKNIYLRDNHTCQYCGRKSNLTVDHIIPRVRGGTESWHNMVTACVRCNNKKGSDTLQESGLKLLRTPFKPPSMLYLEITRLPSAPSSWYHYFSTKGQLKTISVSNN